MNLDPPKHEIGDVIRLSHNRHVLIRNSWFIDDGNWEYQDQDGVIWAERDLAVSPFTRYEAGSTLEAMQNVGMAFFRLTFPIRKFLGML